MNNTKIILASGSPRRRQILHMAGISHEVIISNADETAEGTPDKQVQELALRKARAVAFESQEENNIIIAADTVVFIDGKILNKPQNKAQAFEMLKLLSGRKHTVFTGAAIIRGGCEHVFADAADVYFHKLSDAEIEAYIATGEPFDKAGAYGIQERGALLVEKIEGDFYTVVGLPISKLCHVLKEAGYDVWGTEHFRNAE